MDLCEASLEKSFDWAVIKILSCRQKSLTHLYYRIADLFLDLIMLFSGIRMTSCKSAKDRTSMGVTLEQVNLLSREFDLADTEYQRALDTMRRLLFIWIIFIIILIKSSFFSYCNSCRAYTSNNQTMRDYSLLIITLPNLTYSKSYKVFGYYEKVIIHLNFWNTWYFK